MRFRLPSLATMIGVTLAKKSMRRDLGVYESPLWRAQHAEVNAQRRVKRQLGWYSTSMKMARLVQRLIR